MTAQAVAPKIPRGTGVHVFSHYISAALTTGTNKWEWRVPFACRIVDVLFYSGTAGSGGVSDIADVNINGTTIYTTQANRPTLLTGDTGRWTYAGVGVDIQSPEVATMRAGDVLGFDIDQIASTGSARVTVSIIVVRR